MRLRTHKLQEILRFGVSETKDERAHTRNRVYSLQTNTYGKLLLLILSVALVLYGSNSLQSLIRLFQKLF